jgi:hypothetical protein
MSLRESLERFRETARQMRQLADKLDQDVKYLTSAIGLNEPLEKEKRGNSRPAATVEEEIGRLITGATPPSG